MKLKKKKLNKDKVCFKKRFRETNNLIVLGFGTHCIFFSRGTRIELIYLVMLRKLLKKMKRYHRNKDITFQKTWFWLKKNYPISKKSKNSRMGKGKGKFVRWASRIRPNYILLEFYGWTHCQLKIICLKMNRKCNIFLNIHSNVHTKAQSVMSNKKYTYTLIQSYSEF